MPIIAISIICICLLFFIILILIIFKNHNDKFKEEISFSGDSYSKNWSTSQKKKYCLVINNKMR